jgi:hypothetical protein
VLEGVPFPASTPAAERHRQVNHSQQGLITMRFLNQNNASEIKKSSSCFCDVAKANIARLLCDCPGSEPGIIKTEPTAHIIGCRFRKKSQSKQYTVDTSVVPEKFNDGYALGVAFRQ